MTKVTRYGLGYFMLVSNEIESFMEVIFLFHCLTLFIHILKKSKRYLALEDIPLARLKMC